MGKDLLEKPINQFKEVAMAKKKLYYYELVDGDGSYGIVATNIPEKEFVKLVEEYKESDIYYDNEGLIDFLREKGYEADLIEPIEVDF